MVIGIAVLGVLAFFILRLGKKNKERAKKNNWLKFYAKGKDSGFSFWEISLLRRLAIKSNMEDPASLFWSQNQMDVCIRSLIQNARLAGTERDPETQEFLSKLYEYRKKIEFEKQGAKTGLADTRHIGETQPLRILVAGTGVFPSRILKNANQYIAIDRPPTVNMPRDFTWAGRRLAVYFWRDNDAAYVFDSDVIDEAYAKGSPAIRISHAESLFRTQKRKSLRMKLKKPAFLYIQNEGSVPDLVELVPGLKCVINDISDKGCSVTIGGKAAPGLRVKIQFALNKAPLILCGTVRAVGFNGDENRSALHIEADSLPFETRNEILAEVFGTREADDARPPDAADDEHDLGTLTGVELELEPSSGNTTA